MTIKIKSNLHLIPILKGAVDPSKGIIFRTYYIRPEKLRDMIKNVKTIPSTSYLIHIPNYKDLEMFIKTGNLTYMHNVITKEPNGHTVWDNVVKRNKNFESISNLYYHQKRTLQNIYGFTLTQDKLHTSTLSKDLGKTVKNHKFVVGEDVKVNKPKIKKAKRKKVKEQVREVTSFEDLQFLHFKDDSEIDYGKQITYRYKLYNESDARQFGLKLSAFLNMLQINPIKAKAILSSMITSTSLNDKYRLAGNIILRDSIYMSEPGFWSEFLLNILNNITENPMYYNPENIIYFLSILLRIDKKRALLYQRTFKNKEFEFILLHKPEEIICGNGLNWKEICLYLAALPNKELLKLQPLLMDRLLNIEDVAYRNFMLGSIVSSFPAKTAYNIVKNLHALNIESLIKSYMDNEDILSKVLLNLHIAKLSNTHYIPYDVVDRITDPFYLGVAIKIFPYIYQNNKERLKSIISASETVMKTINNKDFVEVGFDIPANPIDKQVFINLPLVESFPLYKNEPYKLKISKKHIIHFNGDKVLVYMPIDSIMAVENMKTVTKAKTSI